MVLTMCRLAAFPPGTPMEFAHEIVSDFAGGNEHGTGVAYLKGKSFVIQKYPVSYAECVTKKHPLFGHMPHDGWTIAHVRYATHGEKTYANTHPIIRGHSAVCHNGIFSGTPLIKAALNKSVKWQGETDSEVGAYMLNSLGPDEFYKAMPSGAGVWLALNRDGSLSVSKLSGDLEMIQNEKEQIVIASQFPWKGGWKHKASSMTLGVAKVDAKGFAINFKFPKKEERTYGHRHPLYTPQDIGMMRPMNTSPCSTTGSAGQMNVTSCKTREQFSLWDWPEDERMIEYLKDLT